VVRACQAPERIRAKPGRARKRARLGCAERSCTSGLYSGSGLRPILRRVKHAAAGSGSLGCERRIFRLGRDRKCCQSPCRSIRTAAFVLGHSPFALALRYCPSKSASLACPFVCHAGACETRRGFSPSPQVASPEFGRGLRLWLGSKQCPGKEVAEKGSLPDSKNLSASNVSQRPTGDTRHG
jgi:hypothetical protein